MRAKKICALENQDLLSAIFAFSSKLKNGGVCSILTIDNPGFALAIDLRDTEFENKNFPALLFNRSEYDWIDCRMNKGKFEGFCGPANLAELLAIFRGWIEEREVSKDNETLNQLSKWYAKHCNGDWERGNGLSIQLVSESKCHLQINLTETEGSGKKIELYRERLKNQVIARRRPEFEPGSAGGEAAKLKKFSDGAGPQIQRLPDKARTDSSITSGIDTELDCFVKNDVFHAFCHYDNLSKVVEFFLRWINLFNVNFFSSFEKIPFGETVKEKLIEFVCLVEGRVVKNVICFGNFTHFVLNEGVYFNLFSKIKSGDLNKIFGSKICKITLASPFLTLVSDSDNRLIIDLEYVFRGSYVRIEMHAPEKCISSIAAWTSGSQVKDPWVLYI